jgi:hypothetical protein
MASSLKCGSRTSAAGYVVLATLVIGSSIFSGHAGAQSTPAPTSRDSLEEASSSAPASTAAADAQNPISHVISVPLQENLFTRAGPYRKTADTLLVQPVVPFKLDANWSVVTRTIIPIVREPRLSPEQGPVSGIGNVEPQFYLTPSHPGKLIWGAGGQLWLPTASHSELGYNHWGGGPAVVGLTIDGPWVAGALLNNVWAGSGPRRVNLLTLNPFVNYNLRAGWYLASTPVATANWVKKGSDRWTVPVGGGFGRVFPMAGIHLNARLEVFRNVARPDGAPSTQVQFQLQMLFPQHR